MNLGKLIIYVFLTGVLSNFSIDASAQNQEADIVFIKVEEPPQYKGGENKLSAIVAQKVLLKELKDGQSAVFRVFISKEGAVSNVEALYNPFSTKTTLKLMERLKRTSGDWRPGKVNGKANDLSVVLRITRKTNRIVWDI